MEAKRSEIFEAKRSKKLISFCFEAKQKNGSETKNY
jgi:hypothetical protein